MTDINRAGGSADDDMSDTDDLRRRAQEAFTQGLDTARYQAMQARDFAEEQFGQVQEYVTTRVREKPVQSALVALGAGVLLGMILKGGRR
ncbi:MAG TPA: hypothetical protein VF699_11935 [Caulobacteraceae bacterium]|jgi:ElaB/YqjD/DUF883 family membrane-anchored ribosome-binding protein